MSVPRAGLLTVLLAVCLTAPAWAPGGTAPAYAAPGECPPGWVPIRPGEPGPEVDQTVNVFAGGDFTVAGEAAEAEGVVAVLGDAFFGRATAGTYNVGVVGVGSGVAPAPGTDMLVVGGDLGGNAATTVDVGFGIGGDVEVGGVLDPALDLETSGGTASDGVADATTAYDGLPALIAAKAATWAALPVTGTVELTGFSATFRGDGTSDPQVFSVDGASLAGPSRSLQFVGVPADAPVYVTLTGPVAGFDFNAMLGSSGAILDPFSAQEFVDLTTRLMWNVPTATEVTIGGLAQLPGSILVADPASSTTVSAPGTNGRVWVAGDLTHTGVGAEMHNYPFLPDEDLDCRPLVGTGGLQVVKVLDDPDGVVAAGREFTGTFACDLDGVDVTPSDPTWSATVDGPVPLADDLPVGAVCSLEEDTLTAPPGAGWVWGPVTITPDSVTVAEGETLGFTVTNTARRQVVPIVPPVSPPVSPPVAPPVLPPVLDATTVSSPSGGALPATGG